MREVMVAGELYTDLILSGFDFWPRLGQEAFAREFHREVGGGAANTACGLARLGTPAAVLGVVGEDGDWVVQQLQKNGVNTAHISRDAGEPTAFTVAASTPEDRAFLTYAGANRRFPEVLAEAARTRRLSQAAHVHLAFPPDLATAAELFAAIRANGCTLSLDVGWHEDWLRDARVRQILPLLDAFFPNETEAHCMTGETEPQKILRCFADSGIRRVALKLGPRGAALLWDGETWSEAPIAVTPVDTTGAGDCFDAGFLHAWLKGGPPEECLWAGNVCGALSTLAHGGVAGVPNGARLEELRRARCVK